MKKEIIKKRFSTGAQKEVTGKIRLDLVPPEVSESHAEVAELGSHKYGDRNWEKGIPLMECFRAARSHILEWEKGEDINTDDGPFNHLQHAHWWLGAMVTFIKRGRKDLDDRPNFKGETKGGNDANTKAIDN